MATWCWHRSGRCGVARRWQTHHAMVHKVGECCATPSKSASVTVVGIYARDPKNCTVTPWFFFLFFTFQSSPKLCNTLRANIAFGVQNLFLQPITWAMGKPSQCFQCRYTSQDMSECLVTSKVDIHFTAVLNNDELWQTFAANGMHRSLVCHLMPPAIILPPYPGIPSLPEASAGHEKACQSQVTAADCIHATTVSLTSKILRRTSSWSQLRQRRQPLAFRPHGRSLISMYG